MGIPSRLVNMSIFMALIWAGVKDMSDSNVHGLGLRSSSGCCLKICGFGWLGKKLFATGLGGLIPT